MKYIKTFENLKSEQEDAMSWAITKNYDDFVNFLIEQGVNVNKAFLATCDDLNYDKMKNLIDKADINYKQYGRNCIDIIVRARQKDMINYLIEKGASAENSLYYFLDISNMYFDDSWDEMKIFMDFLISKGAKTNTKKMVRGISDFYHNDYNIRHNLLPYLIKNGLDITQDFNKHWKLVNWIMKGLSSDSSGAFKKSMRSIEMQEWFIENQPYDLKKLKDGGINFNKTLLKKHKELIDTVNDSDELGLL